jgi:hypothetical protein
MIQPVGNRFSLPPATAQPIAGASPVGGARFRALVALGRRTGTADRSLHREAATQLLSELFYKPLLKEMRAFPFGRALATGGQVESIFGEKLDERIADRVAGRDDGVLKQIMRQLERFAQTTSAEPVSINHDPASAAGNAPTGSRRAR